MDSRPAERGDAGLTETVLQSDPPQMRLAGPEVPRLLAQLHPLELPRRTTEVLIIGGGVAGLSAALAASETRETLVVLKGARGETATAWAQGGMAVAWGADDGTALHARDTLAVASGLGHPHITEEVVGGARDVVERWLKWGIHF